MGMQDYPGSGYTIEVSKIATLLLPDAQQRLQDLLKEEVDDVEIDEFLAKNWPQILPPFESVYRPKDEDTPDENNMERGEYYVIFAEDDLFERKPTAKMKAMQNLNIEPQFSRWCVWG